MKTKVTRGIFIALEGVDGSGKTTAAKSLAGMMHELVGKTILTHETGGTPIGAAIRKLAYNKHADEVVDPLARLLMLYAARIQHIRNVLDPALTAGTHVITDRYNDSTIVYQGHIDEQLSDMKTLESIKCMRLLSQPADVTVYFKIDPEVAHARGIARSNLDNTTYKGDLDMTRRVCKAYDEVMAAKYKQKPGSVHYIDANLSVDEVVADLRVLAKELVTFVKRMRD